MILAEDENVQYPDDTSLVYVGEDLKVLTDHVNKRLDTIADWCHFNKLVLNPIKSEFMVITNKSFMEEPIVKIGSDNVKMVDEARYLGMFLDSKLCFSGQLSHIQAVLGRYVGITYRLGRYMDYNTGRKMYYACVYSLIKYCIVVWGGVLRCTKRGNDVQRLQTKIIVNLFSHHFPNNNCLFTSLKLLKIIDIYRLYVCIYMYRVIKNDEFPTLHGDLKLEHPVHCYETRQTTLSFSSQESMLLNLILDINLCKYGMNCL